MSYLTTRCLAASVLATVTAHANAVTFIVDDFDGGSDARVTSFIQTPADAFVSAGDMFGARTAGTDSLPFGMADDSVSNVSGVGVFPPDIQGVVGTANLGNGFFGVVDLENPDNPLGTGSAVWTFDVTGLSDLNLSVDVAAMGNFETLNDGFSFSVDGVIVLNFIPDESASFTYDLDSGTTNTLPDPLVESVTNSIIDNATGTSVFQTYAAAITPAGSSITIRFDAASDGGGDAFAFDNLVITGDVAAVPEPTAIMLMGLGLAGLGFARHKRRLNA